LIVLDVSAVDLLLRLGAVASIEVRLLRLPFIERIWTLRSNVSAFDAAYLALAEALDAPVVTADAKLARAPGHHARVELYTR
jgi:predicted nucleic acid-binding protein